MFLDRLFGREPKLKWKPPPGFCFKCMRDVSNVKIDVLYYRELSFADRFGSEERAQIRDSLMNAERALMVHEDHLNQEKVFQFP